MGLSGVTFSYSGGDDSRLILDDVTIQIPQGKITALMGASGGGKTTVLRLLSGQFRPQRGSVDVFGQSVDRLDHTALYALRRRMGMLFQFGALFTDMSVFDNVAFPLRESGERNPKIIRDKVAESLGMVNMTGHELKMPVNLSGGMRKRVALARAIISPPDVILYDEPTAGLDPIVSDSINKLIRHLQRELHVTSIVVTHDMVSCYHIADRVALLNEGRIYFLGNQQELRDSTDPIIRDFVDGRSGETIY